MSLEEYIADMEARQEAAADRAAKLEQLERWLEGQQRAKLEANPYGPFSSKLPVETLRNLTPAEREQIDAAEQTAYHRHQGLARAKEQRKSAFVASGGDPEVYERMWSEGGGREEAAECLANEKIDSYVDEVF